MKKTIFIFPMVGNSSRFFKQDYDKPKYMLKGNHFSIFEEVLWGFRNYYKNHIFLFIFKDWYDTENFIKEKIQKLKIKNVFYTSLKETTSGQGSTVYEGLTEHFPNSDIPIAIFNIDTIRINFKLLDNLKFVDGYVETFNAIGDNWSFISTIDNQKIATIVEKKRISDLCCTGLYYFNSSQKYLSNFIKYKNNIIEQYNETYISGLINYMIQNEKKEFLFNHISDKEIIMVGTPEEYKLYIKNKNNV